MRIDLHCSCGGKNEWSGTFRRTDIGNLPVDADVIRKAQREIASCEHCHWDDVEIPFDWILADVTGKHGAYEFILSEQAKCPNCGQAITEKTLVDRND